MEKGKKKFNPALRHMIIGGKMILYMLIFSLLASVFLMDTIPFWVRMIAGLVFIIPEAFVIFNMGKGQGEKDYKVETKNSLADIHSLKYTSFNIFKPILSVLTFAIPFLILIILSLILGSFGVHAALTLRGIVSILFLPISIFFISCGVLNFKVINWYSGMIFIPSILLICAIYIFGYYVMFMKLKKQQRNIENEIRTFNN